ncbi:hypothetical protein FGE05_04080 [Pseudomonas sp. ICMP22404]|nr:hypothetical protein FGE05_04080 [Pseudomonas sp. ICMP22404]
MEWKGLSKNVNAERTKGYHVASVKMMTNAHGPCLPRIEKRPQAWKVCGPQGSILRRLISPGSARSRSA